MKKETIFYAVFESASQLSDVIEYFDTKKTKKDFFEWLKHHGKELEKKFNFPVVVKYCSII